MHFQALAITCMALHYHSQAWSNSFHELIIISAAFGGYIVILVGILTGIFTGQPVNKRIVRTFIVSGVSLPVYPIHRKKLSESFGTCNLFSNLVKCISCTLKIVAIIFKHCYN
jgi:hypothetical protein